MKPKLFSIIMPTYNCGGKVEKTINSVLSQRRDLFEFIIVDGGSTDDTLSVVERCAGEAKIISEKDRGVYDAYNKGIGLASGNYLYFLGAGDTLRENILERIEEVATGEQLSVIYGGAYFMKCGIYVAGEFDKSDFRKRNICHQAMFYERTIFDVLGKYDLKYSLYADWALNMKCFGRRSLRKKYVRHVIADYEEGGLSDTQDDPNFKNEFPHLIKKYLGVSQYLFYKMDVAQAYLWKWTKKLRAPARSEAESSAVSFVKAKH